MENKLKVITYTATEFRNSLNIIVIDHGGELQGLNPVAVVEGEVHKAKDCPWCASLRKRCQSRRIA